MTGTGSTDVVGIATCRGCGMQREQTAKQWLEDHDHVVPYHDGECDCRDPYWCPGSRECGEFTWAKTTEASAY